VSGFVRPFFATAKPVGARCNLHCRYCYYLDKAGLYPREASHTMGPALLEAFIEQHIGAQPQREVMFVWHGGEPTLLPLQYFRQVVGLQRRHAAGHVVDNCLQTNGTLLDDEWCQFLRDEGWLVGLSIDGTQRQHDRYRQMRGGGGTHHRVMRAVEKLEKYGVQWNAMATINAANVGEPQQFYRFFKSIGCLWLQFTPVVERDGHGRVCDFSVAPQAWGDFLCSLFDEWHAQDVGRVQVQLFDATLAGYLGLPPTLCSFAATCGQALCVEHNGDVYSCDHFVTPDHLLGNLRQTPLLQMAYGKRQQQFGLEKTQGLSDRCRACRYLFVCNGECPKNRFVQAEKERPGENYLCPGYHSFFAHTENAFRQLAKLYRQAHSV